MNKEFMLLNDNTIEVTNEYGQEINRGEFDNNVEDILLSENKIEIVEKIEEKLEKENIENKGVVFLSNGMLKFQIILIILAPIVGFTHGAILHPSDYIIYGIYESIYTLLWVGIPISITTIYYSIIKPIYKKKIKKIETILTKTADMKKNYKEELMEVKQKKKLNH